MWWTDGSRSDDGRVGAAAVCNHSDQWRFNRSYLGTGRMEVFDANMWATGLALEETIEKRAIMQRNAVKMVVLFSDSQGDIRLAARLEPGPGQRLARRINRKVQALLGHSIKTEICWVPGHSGIPGNEEADCQPNVACEAREDTATERPYTSAANTARRISERRSAAKAK
jgi:ribonuclease HI